jgi:UPF0271 protein
VSLVAGGPVIDLNCDLGEERGDDAAILPHVTSISIACGLHAGSPATMHRTVRAAAAAGVAVGAHPGFADRAGFGRQLPAPPLPDLFDLVLYQVGALALFCRHEGLRLQHVKPHGALYHLGARQPEAGLAIARAVRAADRSLIVIGPPASALADGARACGLRFAGEIFADRQYGDDGQLLPRSDPRAVVAAGDPEVGARAATMVLSGRAPTASGATILQPGHTVCLHGDEPEAPARARAVRAALQAAGIRVAPLGAWL